MQRRGRTAFEMHALWAMSITHETTMFGNTPRAGCSISKAV